MVANPIAEYLYKEWHPTKNGDTVLSMMLSSKTKYWWLGECSHEWEASISNRNNVNTGCPYCAGKKVLPGFNDFATIYPDIAAQWHPTKNGDKKATQFTRSSAYKAWWICDKGHEWEASLDKRRNQGCPFCSGKRILPGFNDLASLYPEVATQWHPQRNFGLSPDSISKGSHKAVWWICDKGHEWEAIIKHRTLNKSGCPYCAGQKTIPGQTDLTSTHPELAIQWHPTKNGDLDLSKISYGSHSIKVWWLGDCKHEWEALVSDRSRGNGCPICINQKVLKGFNDLNTKNPQLASQWHPTKNGDLTPECIVYGSNRKVWWKCEKSHEWEATISSRARGVGCSVCSLNIQSSQAEKDISEFILSLGIPIEGSTKTIIPPYELDIFIPSKNIAIEYNGLYWHTEEMGKGSVYHKNKWALCKEQGIQLIQIWEDDWVKKPEIIKSMLAHKLGVTQQTKVFARKTDVVVCSNQQAKDFLTKNHIQGFASGSYYVGLSSQETNELVALIVLKKETGNKLNIIRYATSKNVLGGFSKLLTYVEKVYEPAQLITFSDNCVSDGRLYEQNGFHVDKELNPDYMYVVKGERKHKFGFRLKKFKNDPSLVWREGLTEAQLAKINKLPRIWDAGKTRWVR